MNKSNPSVFLDTSFYENRELTCIIHWQIYQWYQIWFYFPGVLGSTFCFHCWQKLITLCQPAMVNELVKNVHFYKLLELLATIVKNIYQIIIPWLTLFQFLIRCNLISLNISQRITNHMCPTLRPSYDWVRTVEVYRNNHQSYDSKRITHDHVGTYAV